MSERKDIGGHEPDIEVVDYLYGEMTPEYRAAFERRLQEEPALRVEVARLQTLKTRLDGLPGIEPPPDLVDRVISEAHAACRKREQQEIGWLDRLAESFRWLLRPQAGIALAAMLVVAVGIYMAREAKQPSKPGTPEQAREQMRPLPAKSAQEGSDAAPARPGMAEGKAESGKAESGKAENGKADDGVGAADKPPIRDLGGHAREGEAKPAEEVFEKAAGTGEAKPAEEVFKKAAGTKAWDFKNSDVPVADESSRRTSETVPSAEVVGKPATAESPADDGEGRPSAAPAATAGRMTGQKAADGEGGEAAAQGSGGSIAVSTDSTVSSGDTGYRGSEGRKKKETRGLEERDGATAFGYATKSVRLDGEDGLTRNEPLAADLSTTRELDKKMEANADVQFRQEKQAKAQSDMEIRARILADEEARARVAPEEKARAAEAAAIQDVALAEKAVVVREQAGTEEWAEKEESAKARVKEEGWFSDDNGAAAPAEPVVVERRPVVTTGDLRGVEDSADVSLPVSVAAGGATRPGVGEPAQPSPVLVENRYEDSKKKAAGKDAAATTGPVKVDLARDSGLLSLLLGKNREKEEEVNATQESAKAEKKAEAPAVKDEEKVQADRGAAARVVGKVSEKKANLEGEVKAEKGESEQAGAVPVATDTEKAAVQKGELEVARKEEKAQEKVDCAATWNKLLALEKAGRNADALSLLDEFRTGACAGHVSAETIGFKEADLYLASGQKERARKVLNRLKMASPPAEQKAMDMLESIEK